MRWTSPPIPVTVTTLALLIIGPAIGLRQLPRPRAQGLEQLMASASLLQSFEATPDRPVPRLWQQRFGVPLAERLWTQQRHVWWQFWGGHAESDPYLAIPASSLVSLPESEQPPGSIRVDDLLVVPPDPLSRQLLLDRLQPELRPSRGLERRCLKVLEGGQAVFWNPAAVGVITGLLAPFLQRYQEGCLTLELDAGGLLWQGESASVEGLLVEVTPAAAEPLPRSTTEGPEPLPQDLLLEIRGSSLQQLFEGLLSREVIREPLAAVYGIDQKRMAWLKPVPFRLRLRARQKGPFLASIELQIPTGAAKPQWDELLDDLAEVLRKRAAGPLPD